MQCFSTGTGSMGAGGALECVNLTQISGWPLLSLAAQRNADCITLLEYRKCNLLHGYHISKCRKLYASRCLMFGYMFFFFFQGQLKKNKLLWNSAKGFQILFIYLIDTHRKPPTLTYSIAHSNEM